VPERTGAEENICAQEEGSKMEAGEKVKMKRVIICTIHQILLGRSH
jgi:hypothetical protein